MEDEKVIGSTLLLVGIFVIFIGFFMIIIGVALGMFQDSGQDSGSGQDYRRTEPELSRKGDNFEQTSGSWKSPSGQPATGKAEPKVKAGGVIMLGPIPIIFGSDRESAKTAAILAIILMLLSLLFFKGWLF